MKTLAHHADPSFVNYHGENVMLNINAKNSGTEDILYLEGQIVNGETETLRNAVKSLTEAHAIVLDLTRVTTVDAHGLGVMLSMREQTHAEGISFELRNVNTRITKVLEVARLDSVFRITSGVEFFPMVSREHRRSVAA